MWLELAAVAVPSDRDQPSLQLLPFRVAPVLEQGRHREIVPKPSELPLVGTERCGSAELLLSKLDEFLRLLGQYWVDRQQSEQVVP